ncbi:epsilon-lactone hydrolase [Entomortierella parvispora]|uniref:Epsilon-lactone hydrolase n=1 Tax=Entomortierella parvispora TaxID=205924 RepID=A0A9P3HMA4_9FUNG|nr:epsilon-lactone hydrolase [Entomortierella parvispora]
MALMQSFVAQLNHVPVLQSQAMSRLSEEDAPVNPAALATPETVPNSYRDRAAEILDQLLARQGLDATKLGWDWKNDPRAKEPLAGEWTEAREKDEDHVKGRTILYCHGGGYFLASIQTHRWATWAMARLSGSRVFSIDYRLAPSSPFPAAVHDSLAAYLFLIQPPEHSGIDAVDPKDIVIMGDSAGGGLAYGTMLAIRDAGLPMPAGVIGWSPWLDLLHSMPSVFSNVRSDYLPAEGFTQGGQGSIRRVAKLAATIKPDDIVLHHPELPSIQYYASNVALDCPYVSPLCEKNLDGTCPMLVIAGDGEMLRDEAIVFAEKNAGTREDLHLFIYDDMPHVFQMFDFLPSATHAMEASAQFIRKVTCGGEGVKHRKAVRVNVLGEERALEDGIVEGWEKRVGKLGGGREVLISLLS